MGNGNEDSLLSSLNCPFFHCCYLKEIVLFFLFGIPPHLARNMSAWSRMAANCAARGLPGYFTKLCSNVLPDPGLTESEKPVRMGR